MGREQVKNYLDIQLRDMDYLNVYGGNLRAAFLDPANWYDTGGYFEKKYQEALTKAKTALDMHKANTVQTDNPVLQTLFNLYRQRLLREKNFIKEWEKFFGVSRKGQLAYPMNGNYTLEANKRYAEGFSAFIQSAIGSSDDEIVAALRNEAFAARIVGLESKVLPEKVADRQKRGKKKGQSNINLYYERLFDTFFYGAKGAKKAGSIPVSLDDMINNGERVGSKVFRDKFLKFIKLYYNEISPQVEAGLDALGAEAAERIYRNFYKDNPGAFRFKVDKGKGVSKMTDKQLKRMLLTTLREIADANGAQGNYQDFTIPGLLEVNKAWDEDEKGFHMSIYLLVEKLKAQRDDLKSRKARGEHIDMRHYNRTYLVDHEDDMVLDTSGNLTLLKNLFLMYFKDELSAFIGRQLTSQEETDLSRAIFLKIDKTIKRGDKALAMMTIFGSSQMKGFLGEVAVAYSLQKGQGVNGEKVYTETMGATGKMHYNVVATIRDTMVGFQVKNYNNIDSRNRTLFKTNVSLDGNEMYKYFSNETVKYYRWLFANGRYISQTDIPNLKEQMEMSLYNSMDTFLRISDASIPGGIDSDIYVLGNFYIPSSYLICCAIDRVKRELAAQGKESLFSLTGDFPAYRYKLFPTTSIDSRTGAVTEVHKTSGMDLNIVWLDRAKGLGKGLITFKGINIKFTI